MTMTNQAANGPGPGASTVSETLGEYAQRVCPECGRRSPTANGLAIHRARAHGVAGTTASARNRRWRERQQAQVEPEPEPKRRVRREVASELALCEMLHDLYPKGIATDDPTKLFEDLRFIEDLRTRLGGK